MHKPDKHILGWTTWILLAFILGALAHVFILGPLADREFAQYAEKSSQYLGVKTRDIDIPQETLDLIEPENIIQDVLRQSGQERKSMEFRPINPVQRKEYEPPLDLPVPSPIARDFTVEPTDSKE